MATPVTTTDPQENTTPADPTTVAATRLPSIRTLPVAGLTVLVGAILLYLGVPPTIDAIWRYSGDRTLRAIQAQETVSNEEVEDLIEVLDRSLFLVESGRKWTDLGLAQLLRSARITGQTESRELLVGARASLREGSALGPANGFAWTRLAYVETLISGPSAEVARILEMAILTAPFDPRLLFFRLQLCFLAWPYFDQEARDLVLQQVRHAWREAPGQLVDLAVAAERVDVVRAALSRSPDDLEHFEEHLGQ